MRTELALQWEMVEEEMPKMFKSVEEAVDESFGEIQATMRCKHSVPFTPVIQDKATCWNLLTRGPLMFFLEALGAVPTLSESVSSRFQDIKYKLQLAQRTIQQAFK